MSDELLVNLSMRFPALDRTALAAHLAPVVEAAIAAGGNFTSISVMPYDDEEDE
ncbi:MAG TPA: hypothetical protein VK631_06690 [Solirubrobacteraceae bacterium]|nr:hypothetical protein [Solirubrobacteraceae bacterium]